jgi:hypothetical protein
MKNNNEKLDRNLITLLGKLLPTPQRDVKAVASGRQNFMQRVDRYLAQGKLPAPATNRWSVFTQKRLAMVALTLVLVLTFLVSSGAGVAVAARNTLPGDTLYSVKTLGEDTRLAFTSDSIAKFDLLATYVMLRFTEIDALQEQDAVITPSVTYRLSNQLDTMLLLAASMDDTNLVTSLIDMQKILLGGELMLVTTGDQDRIRDNYQILLMTKILKQDRDYLDLVELGVHDPAGFRYMYAYTYMYNGLNKPTDPGSGTGIGTGLGNGTGSGSANTDPGNLDAQGPGPGVGADNSFGPGTITTVITDEFGITSTVTLPGMWGPGATGGIVITDVLTDAAYGVGPGDSLYYYWGDGSYGTPSDDAAQKQLEKRDQ